MWNFVYSICWNVRPLGFVFSLDSVLNWHLCTPHNMTRRPLICFTLSIFFSSTPGCYVTLCSVVNIHTYIYYGTHIQENKRHWEPEVPPKRQCILTPWNGVLLEKLTDPQIAKKFPEFYGTRRFITAFTTARYLSLSWARSIQSTPPTPHFLEIHFNIILPLVYLYLKTLFHDLQHSINNTALTTVNFVLITSV